MRTEEKEAFTLVELLVVLGVFGLIMFALLQFLTNFLNMKFNSEARQRIRTEGNYVVDQIDYLIRNGTTVPDICQGINRENPDSGEKNEIVTNFEETTNGVKQTIKKRVCLADKQIVLTEDIAASCAEAAKTGLLLTASREQSNKSPIIVNEGSLTFRCEENSFTNGLVVTTKLTMTVERQSMGAGRKDGQPLEIVESFTKTTAIRNRFDY